MFKTIAPLLLVGGGMMIAACDSDDSDSDESSEDVNSSSQPGTDPTNGSRLAITAASSSPTILVHNKNGGEDALIEGYVRYLDSLDCWVLVAVPGSGFRQVLVWPMDSDPAPIENDGQVVGVTVDGTDINLGEWLKVRGGGRDPVDVDAPDIAEECFGRTEPRSYQLVDEILDVTQEPPTTSPQSTNP